MIGGLLRVGSPIGGRRVDHRHVERNAFDGIVAIHVGQARRRQLGRDRVDQLVVLKDGAMALKMRAYGRALARSRPHNHLDLARCALAQHRVQLGVAGQGRAERHAQSGDGGAKREDQAEPRGSCQRHVAYWRNNSDWT